MITVVMTTYMSSDFDGAQRMRYMDASMNTLLRDLVADEPVRLHIADDGSNHPEAIKAIAQCLQRAHSHWGTKATWTSTSHEGIGASLNRALERVFADGDDMWLYTTDDWSLINKLDLTGPAKLIRNGYDLVRLGPVHPDLCCTTRFDQTIGWWLDLLQHYGGFAFATRPFLASKTFYEKIGPFDERLNSYETERLYAERVAKSTAKLAYWGGIDLHGPWHHEGITCVGYKDV